ncbi:MAG TPA: methyltransferase domain-containing protein [Elusimicrobiota bacterium]|nr:methyltransferase domain-containing protein [Elusimicrobiota bacterium]
MSSSRAVHEYFDKSRSSVYDEKIRISIPGYEALHQMTAQLFRTVLPSDARVLLAGVGTGAELCALGRTAPGWSFIALDVTKDMLDRCRRNAEELGLTDRVEFVWGAVDTAPRGPYQGAASILVSHFLKTVDEKRRFFREIADRLAPGGALITAELVSGGNVATDDLVMEAWKNTNLSGGISPAEVKDNFEKRKQFVAEPSEEELVGLLRESGFKDVRRFYQAFNFVGHLCLKSR